MDYMTMRLSLRTIYVAFVVIIMMGFLTFMYTGVSLGVTPDDQTPRRASLKKLSLKDGSFVTLVAEISDPFATLVIDGEYLYFSEMAGTIRKVPVQGGKVTTLARGLAVPRDLAVDDGWIYFAEATGRGKGAIKKVSVNGGEVTTLAKGVANPMRIAVDSDYVYFCENAAPGAIKKVSKYTKDGHVLTLVDALTFPVGPAVVDKTLFFIEQATPGTLNKVSTEGGPRTVLLEGVQLPEPYVFDQTHIYFVEFVEGQEGMIKRIPMPMTGSEAAVSAGDLKNPGRIAVDEEDVYFSERTSGTVNKVSKSGGPLTIDGSYVYFADRGKGTVNRAHKSGGAVAQLMDGLHDPFLIAVHADNVFVVETYAEIESVP